MAMPPVGYYMNNCSVNALHMHKATFAVDQPTHITRQILPYQPQETVASVQAGLASRAVLYTNEGRRG